MAGMFHAKLYTRTYTIILALAIPGIVAIVVCVLCSGPPSPAKVALPAKDLMKAFDKEAEGNAKYRGEWLTLEGKISSISKHDASGDYCLDMSGVHCFFSSSRLNELTNLKGGQTIVIQGRCSGKLENKEAKARMNRAMEGAGQRVSSRQFYEDLSQGMPLADYLYTVVVERCRVVNR